jgi:hypothetical protein
MSKKTIWAGRSSPALFIYEYLGILLLAYLLQRFIGGYMLIYALPGIVYYVSKARSMRYVFSDEDVHFTPSIGDDETITVPLTDILEIQVVDRPPWSLLGLGTIILITDPDAEMHPCMKCIHEPRALANTIRTKARALGAPSFPIETV